MIKCAYYFENAPSGPSFLIGYFLVRADDPGSDSSLPNKSTVNPLIILKLETMISKLPSICLQQSFHVAISFCSGWRSDRNRIKFGPTASRIRPIRIMILVHLVGTNLEGFITYRYEYERFNCTLDEFGPVPIAPLPNIFLSFLKKHRSFVSQKLVKDCPLLANLSISCFSPFNSTGNHTPLQMSIPVKVLEG